MHLTWMSHKNLYSRLLYGLFTLLDLRLSLGGGDDKKLFTSRISRIQF